MPSTPSRQERAAGTRLRIVQAALRLFSEQGLATPLTAVAAEAGVAVQTVRFVFNTKSKLVFAAHEYAVGGDTGAEPMARMMQALAKDGTSGAVIRALVDLNADIQPRVGRLMAQMQTSDDPEVAAYTRQAEQLRVEHFGRLAGEMARRGGLREEMDPEQARDILLALTSPSLGAYFLHDRGWSVSRWHDWLLRCLIEQLLPPAGGSAPLRAGAAL